jgi:hypothetical protein
MGNDECAIPELNRSLTFEPEDVGAYDNFSAHEHEHADGYYGRGSAYALKGDRGQAIADYRKLLK